jgi:hypothetical protein
VLAMGRAERIVDRLTYGGNIVEIGTVTPP